MVAVDVGRSLPGGFARARDDPAAAMARAQLMCKARVTARGMWTDNGRLLKLIRREALGACGSMPPDVRYARASASASAAYCPPLRRPRTRRPAHDCTICRAVRPAPRRNAHWSHPSTVSSSRARPCGVAARVLSSCVDLRAMTFGPVARCDAMPTVVVLPAGRSFSGWGWTCGARWAPLDCASGVASPGSIGRAARLLRHAAWEQLLQVAQRRGCRRVCRGGGAVLHTDREHCTRDEQLRTDVRWCGVCAVCRLWSGS